VFKAIRPLQEDLVLLEYFLAHLDQQMARQFHSLMEGQLVLWRQ
jgi:hypothetical protein